jgi:hypothetical protein
MITMGELDELLRVSGLWILLFGSVSAWMVGLVQISKLYGTPASLLATMATGIVLYGIGTLVAN